MPDTRSADTCLRSRLKRSVSGETKYWQQKRFKRLRLCASSNRCIFITPGLAPRQPPSPAILSNAKTPRFLCNIFGLPPGHGGFPHGPHRGFPHAKNRVPPRCVNRPAAIYFGREGKTVIENPYTYRAGQIHIPCPKMKRWAIRPV